MYCIDVDEMSLKSMDVLVSSAKSTDVESRARYSVVVLVA
jgi:hypothetical protein